MDYNKRTTFYSVEEALSDALPYIAGDTKEYYGALKRDWSSVGSVAELKGLARNGWREAEAEALAIAESAVDSVEQDHDMPHFRALWDVSGCEVDVARYLSGEPENMVDYEMTQTPRAGRVIVLCASVCYSGAVEADTIKRRGHGIAALAFALSRMGLNVELWADFSVQGLNQMGEGKPVGTCRVLVKGANDELDPARIMFAYAHPGMSRSVMMPAMYTWGRGLRKYYDIGGGHGYPVDPVEDMPEGAIYLPAVLSSTDVPDADEILTGHLRLLGLID